jgi:AcrR family transcriptional regulator
MRIVQKVAEPSPGLRERKRQQTLRRITDAGICLFIDKGIDATTLDEIAAMAGISRRTFFHYFKSKDDILLTLQSGMGEMIAAQVRLADDAVSPIKAIRDAVIAVCADVPAEDMVAIDRLMRSSPAVQARKQATYVEHERTLFAALRERWPDPAREMALRLVAMLAIGAARLAADALAVEGEQRTLIELLEAAFDALTNELSGAIIDDRTRSSRA